MKQIGTQFEPIHLDARPGGRGPFCPPGEVEDYAAWLLGEAKTREEKSTSGKYTLCQGVSQKLQHVVAVAKTGAQVRTSGRYAGALAAVIEGMVGDGYQVEVLG
ncbi:MAG: hypothetical protein AB1450_08175 [Pseudomonadota bacterium]